MDELGNNKICDHTSVGMLVWRDSKLLLIERRNFPCGFAPPAGHVDGDSSFEVAASRELEEEVDLKTKKLKVLAEANINNSCSRREGTWHHWKIYEVEVEGEIKRNIHETVRAEWISFQVLKQLARRTEAYLEKRIMEKEWEESPGLELVWFEWFRKLGIL